MANNFLIDAWKEQVKNTLKILHPEDNDELIDQFLEHELKLDFQDRKACLVNEYTEKIVGSNVTELMQFVKDNKVITGGDAVFYAPHDKTDNPLLSYLIAGQETRSFYKNKMKAAPDGSLEKQHYDREQSNAKIAQNSIYGILNYIGFLLYRPCLGSSVTGLGRLIISLCTQTFEMFLAGNVNFLTFDEVIIYITNHHNDYMESLTDDEVLPNLNQISKQKLYEHMIDHCDFAITEEQSKILFDMINSLSDSKLRTYIYYKNNLVEFCRNDIIKQLMNNFYSTTPVLQAAFFPKDIDDNTKTLYKTLWTMFRTYVVDTYPLYDKVRRTMYKKRKVVLYMDTDSNMLGMYPWYMFVQGEILNGNTYGMTRPDMKYTIVNSMAMIISALVQSNMLELARSMNVTDEYGKRLDMKNEFLFDIMLFCNVKKRYLALKVLQEGNLIFDGNGDGEFKGFDFIKIQTKPFLREEFIQICWDEIFSKSNDGEIDTIAILRRILALQKQIEEMVRSNDSRILKQASIMSLARYKKPYSIPIVKGIFLWNCLNPNMQISIPADVDLIPVKLTNKSELKQFADKFPEQYKLIEDNIFNNDNPSIANMTLNVIARPKVTDYINDSWLDFILNTDKIVNDSIGLFYPILTSLGIQLPGRKTDTQYLSNIVSL